MCNKIMLTIEIILKLLQCFTISSYIEIKRRNNFSFFISQVTTCEIISAAEIIAK